MSHMSIWDAPPHKKNRMVDFAEVELDAGRLGVAATPGVPNAIPANPTPEATRKVRRVVRCPLGVICWNMGRYYGKAKYHLEPQIAL